MRLTADGTIDLTYCTNIHAADGWPAVRDNVARYGRALKARLSPTSPLGIGLRLSARESEELLAGDHLDEFRSFLDDEGLYVAVINGFPYGPFHGTPVKANVYAPDWRDRARADYTSNLVRILTRLLPSGMDGGISTAPISYKAWMGWGDESGWTAVRRNLEHVVEAMYRAREAHDVSLHLDIEPEPDCVVETTDEAIALFTRRLMPAMRPSLARRLGIDEDDAERVLRDHIQICFDCCHVSVEHEDPLLAIGRLTDAGIGIGRVQLSSALRVAVPDSSAGFDAVETTLRPFADSTYLHQVVCQHDGRLVHLPDLDEALAARQPGEWRVHFHVPLFARAFGALGSTQDDVGRVIGEARRQGFTRHLEIETYTWGVLPDGLKLDLVDSIAREYAWVLGEWSRAGGIDAVKKTVVLNVVGLTPALAARMPKLSAWQTAGASATIAPAFPAVTCTAQADYLTGVTASAHGIVGNGWYSREDHEVRFWKQSNALVQAPKIWDVARAEDQTFTCANLFWWFNMYSSVDYAVTPRPMYPADGRKIPDVHTHPASLRDDLQGALGTFPLFEFWGPRASIRSTQWIADATLRVDKTHSPTLTLVYLPHLDYNLQRLGTSDPRIQADLDAVDAVCSELIAHYESLGAGVVVLSEYGIRDVSRPVHLNRAFREHGLLAVRAEQGLDVFDAGASAAFAVADHQIAHVYVNDATRLAEVRAIVENTPGVSEVLGGADLQARGLAHARCGDLVAVAAPDAWFTYYYWTDDRRAPDYARTVDIHRKPGYDPVELFLDPAIRVPALTVGWKIAKRKLGFRSLLDVIPLDAALVKGSHGRADGAGDHGPMLITNRPALLRAHELASTDVFSVLLDHLRRGA